MKARDIVKEATDYTLPQDAKRISAVRHNEWQPMDASYCITFKVEREEIEQIKLNFPEIRNIQRMPMKGCSRLRGQADNELTVRDKSDGRGSSKRLSFLHVDEEKGFVTFEIYSLW